MSVPLPLLRGARVDDFVAYGQDAIQGHTHNIWADRQDPDLNISRLYEDFARHNGDMPGANTTATAIDSARRARYMEAFPDEFRMYNRDIQERHTTIPEEWLRPIRGDDAYIDPARVSYQTRRVDPPHLQRMDNQSTFRTVSSAKASPTDKTSADEYSELSKRQLDTERSLELYEARLADLEKTVVAQEELLNKLVRLLAKMKGGSDVVGN